MPNTKRMREIEANVNKVVESRKWQMEYSSLIRQETDPISRIYMTGYYWGHGHWVTGDCPEGCVADAQKAQALKKAPFSRWDGQTGEGIGNSMGLLKASRQRIPVAEFVQRVESERGVEGLRCSLAERLRVNVGLLHENVLLKRKLRRMS